MHKIFLTGLVSASLLLSGCAAVVVGGAAVGTVNVSEDKRTLGVQLDDRTFESRIQRALDDNETIDETSNVKAYVYNGIALLVGQAPTQQLINQAEQLALKAADIKKVHNQIRLGNPTAVTTKAHDAWLSSKVRAKLLATKEVNTFQLEVVVEDSEVFLLGLVSREQAEQAVNVARNVSGVIKVVNAFEII